MCNWWSRRTNYVLAKLFRKFFYSDAFGILDRFSGRIRRSRLGIGNDCAVFTQEYLTHCRQRMGTAGQSKYRSLLRKGRIKVDRNKDFNLLKISIGHAQSSGSPQSHIFANLTNIQS